MAAEVHMEEAGDVIVLSSNNYLGLSDEPSVGEAGKRGRDRYGAGTASVRFICGTFDIHRVLEDRIAAFLGTEASLTYVSCWNANTGLFATICGPGFAILSDQLNHASIIDGVRLCKARRLRYANGDMDELEARLRESAGARYRLIATDGVFSMDGYFARLDAICDLAERHDALVMVDDSHAVGVAGPNGRGSHERHAVVGRVDILTGTLGKAIAGASGGYVSARREIVEILRQRGRPYLFSNSLAPPVAAASLHALDLIETSHDLRQHLQTNTAHFRTRMSELGFDVLPGEHPIVPVMVGDEVRAARLADELAARGVYAVSFSYPVVPRGTARIRTQMSAAHTTEDLDFAIEQFVAAHGQVGDQPA